jgi:hypothetical protein
MVMEASATALAMMAVTGAVEAATARQVTAVLTAHPAAVIRRAVIPPAAEAIPAAGTGNQSW